MKKLFCSRRFYTVIFACIFSTNINAAHPQNYKMEKLSCVPFCTNPFDGFYVTPTVALHQTSVTHNVDTDIPVGTTSPFFIGTQLPNLTGGGGSIEGYWGVQAGYGRVVLQRYYVGGVLFGEWGNNQDSSHTNAAAVASLPTPVTAQITSTAEVDTTISNHFGIAYKQGVLVSPNTMLYAKIGLGWANITTSGNVTLNASIEDTVSAANATLTSPSDQTHRKLGILLGAGAEQFVYKDIVSLTFEYNYYDYGSVTTPDTHFRAIVDGAAPVPLPLTAEASSNVKMSSFLAGINVHFG